MNNITVVILSQNDEDVIKDSILSAKELTENILVVDSNKNNLTYNVADKLKVKVVKNPFKNFADQRNFGLDYTTTDWILYLDSDERLTPEFIKEVKTTIENFNETDNIGGFFIRRKTFFYNHDWNFTDRVQRLFYRKRLVEWRGVVHETPNIKGEFGELSAPILHYTHRNLSQMVRKTNDWSEYEARLRFQENHPPLAAWRFIRVMVTEFLQSYIKNKGYKNGTLGFIEAMYQAFSIYITYAKLWELQQKK